MDFNPYAADEAEIANKMKMAQALQGRRGLFWQMKAPGQTEQAMKLMQALQQRQQGDVSADMSAISQALQGRPAQPAVAQPSEELGGGPGRPEIPGRTPQQMMAEALGSMRSPQGMQQALRMATPEAPYTLKPGEQRMGPGGQVIARGAAERPTTEQRPVSISPGGQLVSPTGKVLATNPHKPAPEQKSPPGYRSTPTGDLEAIPGGPADLKLQGQFNQDTASLTNTESALDRLSTAANEVMRHPGLEGITGLRGALPDVPGTNAANARAKLQTLKAQVGFNVLQEMRNASKTGGALGSITEKELGFLQSALAALDTAQDADQYRESLQKIMDYSAGAKSRLRGAFNLKHSKPSGPPGGKERRQPKQGDVIDGYKFRGGNPADRNSWEKVQ